MTPLATSCPQPAVGSAACPPNRVIHGIPELVAAAILLVLAFRSLRKWVRIRFEAASTLEHVLFSLYVASRVGMWFALAGFFIGYAFVDEPQKLGWYALVLIGLAGVQLLSSFFLSRSPDAWRRREGPPNGE